MSTADAVHALIYARVSTAGQGDNYSLPTQIDGCRAYAGTHGYVVTHEVVDQHTGTVLERPGIEEMLGHVHGGAVDVVLVYDLDRFTRDPDHLAILEYEIEETGARVEYVLGNFANTPEGKLSKAVKAAIAQFENRQRGERSRRGRRGRAAAGFVLPKGGGAPMGYRYVRDGDHKGHLEIDEMPAQTVRRLFSWADAGWTVHQIVVRLNGDETPSPTGVKWVPSAVQRILRNTIYNGIWYHNMQKREAKPGKRSSTTLRPREEWIPVQVPALVDEEIWQRVQQRLDTSARSRPRKRTFLLTGHILCACGRNWEGRVRDETLRYYRCPTIKEKRWREPCAMAGNIRMDVLDAAVWGAVERLLLDPQMVEAEVRRRQTLAEAERAKADKRVRELTVQAKRVERQVQGLLGRLLEGELTSEQVKTEKQKLDAQHAAVLQERDAAARARDDHAEPADANDLRRLLDDLRTAMKDLGFESRRRILERLELRVDILSISASGSDVQVTTVLGLAPIKLTLPPGRRTKLLTEAQEKRSR